MRHDTQAGVHLYELSDVARAVVKAKSNIPLVTIAVAARGSVHNSNTAAAGLNGLLARNSIKGTASRSAAQIAELAEGMGGSVAPSANADVVDWEITVPARHFDRALDLVCDVAFNAEFPEAEFEIERKLTLGDLQHLRDDMFRYPLRLCMEQGFRGHQYGTTLTEVESTIAAATPPELRSWHRTQICAEPWVFVVGDVDPDATARAIAALLPQTSEPSRPEALAAAWSGGTTAAEARDKAQTALAIAFPGPARNDPSVYAFQLLANAVGGLGGRFFEELRSKRSLAYTVNLLPVNRWLGGAFVAYIATSPEREDEARQGLVDQFARLVNEPLADVEVQRAQRYTIGTWQIRSQTNSSQLGELMHAYLLGPGVSEVLDFEEHVLAVTPATILAAAQQYFDPAQAVQGIVRGKGQSNAS